jgi:hypothetical protein
VCSPTDGWLGFRQGDLGWTERHESRNTGRHLSRQKPWGDVGTIRRAFDPKEFSVPSDARRSMFASAARQLRPRARGLAEIARVPHAPALAGASLIARLPRGMAALAIVLLVHEATGSYAVAGAALAVGDAVVSPLQGRLVDRLGPARVLMPSAAVYALALTVLALLATAAGPIWSIVLAGVAGAAFPPVSASMKTLWPALVDVPRDVPNVG